MTLKDQVECILKEFPKSRDSDQWLTLKIWAVFYPKSIRVETMTLTDGSTQSRKYVYLDDIMELPREDNVKRHRAHFQNDLGMYSASPDIAKKRGQKEREWKQDMLASTR